MIAVTPNVVAENNMNLFSYSFGESQFHWAKVKLLAALIPSGALARIHFLVLFPSF